MTSVKVSEKWLPVKSFEGMYDISDQGRIWSRPRMNLRGQMRRGRHRRFRVGKHGYYQLQLSNEYGEKIDVRVHQVVAATFLGPRPKGKQINHKNGIKTDNRASNLEYVTASENVQHAYDNGLIEHYHGEEHWKAYMNAWMVRVIRRLKGTLSYSEIGEVFGTSKYNIYMICSGKNWKHVTHPNYREMIARGEPLTFGEKPCLP